MTGSVLLTAQQRSQATANKPVERRESVPMGMLEVAVPASQSRVERRNHASDGAAHSLLRLRADFIAQGHQTFLARPTLPCLKPVAQKLEPLTRHPAIPNMGFVRMQPQAVRMHPITHAG